MRGVVFALFLLAGCGGRSERTLRVLAAASATGPVRELGAAFEQKNPGVKVELSFGSSTAHERQIEAGAACDVFVAASRKNVERLAAKGLIESACPTVARNALVAIVPRGEAVPADVAALASLARVAVGARVLAHGDAAREALGGALPDSKLAGYPDEPAVVTAVARGAAPAGICYSSSVAGEAGVTRAFALPTRTPIEYPAALVKSGDATLGRAFLALLLSEEGRATFARHGFGGESEFANGGAGVPPAHGRAGETPAPRTPPRGHGELRALLVSLEVASLALLLMLPPGLALAFLLARGPTRLRTAIEALVMLPLVLPPVAIGVGLLAIFGRQGLGFLSLVGTWQGASLAAAVVALPVFVRVARAALEDVDPRLEAIASVLGAPPWRVALTITLPLARRGLLAATILGFARALGEFGATIVVAGAVSGETETLPIAIFQAFEERGSAASLCLVSGALALGLAALSAWLSPRRTT